MCRSRSVYISSPVRIRAIFVCTNSTSLGRHCFVKNGLHWAVKAEQRVPTLGRIGLNPVALVHASRFDRSKIDSGGAVGVGHRRRSRIALAAGPRISLRGLQH